ncbi:MAG: ABC transporter permease, partial [Verrucomicrobiota bacterium]|nr:ABC transporter permease [Verrucomicrobiota bacterium]
MNNIRFAFRQLRKAPGFTLTALATVAICLGANLAIFAVINSILLRPLPFPQSDRLVTIFNTYPKAGVERLGASLTNYYERRDSIPAFSNLSIFRDGNEVVGETGSAEQTQIMRVSPDFFATLGVNLAMGRTFTEDEAEIAKGKGAGVAIVTDAYWRQRLNSDPNVLGRDIRVNTMPRKIVGVLPPDFRFLSSEARLILPIRSRLEERTPNQRHSDSYNNMIARLKPGATIAEAQSQIDAHNAAVETNKIVADTGFRSLVVPLHADHVRSIRPTLLLMQAGVFFLLLIGAVNLINLLLIRASDRAKEMAIRQSIGASRWHVVKQVMIETVVLTAVGGLLGLVVGAWGIRLLEVLGADH